MYSKTQAKYFPVDVGPKAIGRPDERLVCVSLEFSTTSSNSSGVTPCRAICSMISSFQMNRTCSMKFTYMLICGLGRSKFNGAAAYFIHGKDALLKSATGNGIASMLSLWPIGGLSAQHSNRQQEMESLQWGLLTEGENKTTLLQVDFLFNFYLTRNRIKRLFLIS